MEFLEALGEIVRRERKRRLLTQEGLAELAELHSNYISLMERGRTAPALDTLVAISTALGRRPSQLLRAAERLTNWTVPKTGSRPPRRRD